MSDDLLARAEAYLREAEIDNKRVAARYGEDSRPMPPHVNLISELAATVKDVRTDLRISQEQWEAQCKRTEAAERELADARAMWGREYEKALNKAADAEERAETAERALAAFRRSFEGHVYVKNEEFAALCADRRALAACEERLTWAEDEVAVSDAALAALNDPFKVAVFDQLQEARRTIQDRDAELAEARGLLADALQTAENQSDGVTIAWWAPNVRRFLVARPAPRGEEP